MKREETMAGDLEAVVPDLVSTVASPGARPPSALPRWRKLIRKLREVGPLYTLQLLLMKIPPGIFYANRFYIFALDLGIWQPPQQEDREVRFAGPNEIDLLATSGRSLTMIRQRFEAGCRVTLIERDGRMVGHAWFAPVQLVCEHRLVITGSPRDFWSIDGWVAPECRGQRLYNRIKAQGAARYAREGADRLLSHVDRLNRNSARASHALGAEVIGTGFIVTLFGVSLVRFGRSFRFGCWSSRRPLELPLALLAR